MQEHIQASEEIMQAPLTSVCRPWTRWWWMGSAVDEAEIMRHLYLFQQAGIGGVEISPIYAVTGEEGRSIPFLSLRWIELLRYTVREARRMGMDVDMITGTGWPLGGPWVSAEDAAAKVVVESYTVAGGGRVEQPISSTDAPGALPQALIAFSQDDRLLDLGPRLDSQRRLDWEAPDGQWRVYALFQIGTSQQVKRAAPGGEGHVLDHFSAGAVSRYLDHFDRAFVGMPAEEQVRCFFNDSYEVYEANWTPELLSQFQQRRGYDLRHYLPALSGDGDPQIISRVRSDYRQTVADLLLDAFVRPWSAWAQRHGALARNQAHGSPGNLLDLYAAADIPETETFGPDWLRLAGLAPSPGTPPQQGGRADVLIGKLASSAAHVAGRPLCSSESFTWLDEHGKVSLAEMKATLDVSFVMGINHVFFHGTPFSPADAEWPGWMFYATSHVAPTNPFWGDLATLNTYISRCQALLQAGSPDNDLLLYLPIFDLWASDQNAEHWLHVLTVHAEHWLDQNLAAFRVVARQLWDRGYSFDLISDQLLIQALQVAEQQLQSRGGTYRALLVAGCTLMPPETLEQIVELARAGATVLVVGDLPSDVPGLGQLDTRRQQLYTAISALDPRDMLQPGVWEARPGKGRLLVGADVEVLLQLAGIQRESIVDTGVELIRRCHEHGYLYFLSNLGQQPVDGWMRLAVQAESVRIEDPASERSGMAQVKNSNNATTEVYLQIEPGESLLLRASTQPETGPTWAYLSPAGPPVPIEGAWRVEFITGGPTLPPATIVQHLTSWTEWPDKSAEFQAFSGTARYIISFEKPDSDADAWAIDLGVVCNSARVRLNGQELGTLYARPFRIILPGGLRKGENHLDIEVTNLMGNRLAHLDRTGQPWQRFFFVNIEYQRFDASDWEPLPSGLLGPVRLVPLGALPLSKRNSH